MATEHVLRMRIQNAAKKAAEANARQDSRAYEQARAAYEAADAALRLLEKERNMQAIEDLEAKARHGELSYATIVDSGVPFEVLRGRGWRDMTNKAGMWRPAVGEAEAPAKPHLTVVPDEPEPDGVA